MIRESPQAQNLWVEVKMYNILLASCVIYQPPLSPNLFLLELI